MTEDFETRSGSQLYAGFFAALEGYDALTSEVIVAGVNLVVRLSQNSADDPIFMHVERGCASVLFAFRNTDHLLEMEAGNWGLASDTIFPDLAGRFLALFEGILHYLKTDADAFPPTPPREALPTVIVDWKALGGGPET